MKLSSFTRKWQRHVLSLAVDLDHRQILTSRWTCLTLQFSPDKNSVPQEHEVEEPPASPTQQMSDRDVAKLILVTPSRSRRPDPEAAEQPPGDPAPAVGSSGPSPADQPEQQLEHPARHLSGPEVRQSCSAMVGVHEHSKVAWTQ